MIKKRTEQLKKVFEQKRIEQNGRKIIIDEALKKADSFQKLLNDPDWTIVRTLLEALRAVKTKERLELRIESKTEWDYLSRSIECDTAIFIVNKLLDAPAKFINEALQIREAKLNEKHGNENAKTNTK